jgi:DNA polymerase I - 3''-5'' exonuclease and polymerase domains
MKSVYFHVTEEDTKYLSFLKPILNGKCTVRLGNTPLTLGLELILRAKEAGCTAIATSCETTLQMFLGKGKKLDDYEGSMIERHGMEILFVPPVKQLLTIPYMRHLYERYFDKYIHPERWLTIPKFEWELFDPSQVDRWMDILSSASFVSCDIETGPEGDRVITCIGFTAVRIDAASNSFTVATIVVPFTDLFNLVFVSNVLSLPVPKVFQNGKYDNAYLLRYNMPTINYAFDTMYMFHCWYSELPKTLDFITGYLLRKWEFWKDESKTTDLLQYYEYNAKDCFTTAMSLLAIFLEFPDYAIKNYLMEFPVMFPCMLTEATGILCDKKAMADNAEKMELTIAKELHELQQMVNAPGYNPNSPKQTGQLFHILGCKDIKGTGKIPQDKAGARHPLNKVIMKKIEKIRGSRKLASSYLKEDVLWNDRIYYSLNPHGTDTGRNASKESQFWCGLQIQNIPRDRKDIQVKDQFISYSGFYMGEADGEQAEARDTAYLSGDLKLIAAVEDHTKDFHGYNASSFFGIPYDRIVKSYALANGLWKHDVLDKDIRDLSKRTNHGANYNMGPDVMVDTMGIENVIRARTLLGLPQHWPLRKVCDYLLTKYAETYPVVKGAWYDKCSADVMGTGFLIGPTGWTRRCFGDPTKNKHDLNRYVAHPPQSLNAMVMNQAYRKVFHEIYLPNPQDFKLGPQIHDSIVFQYRIGRQDLAWKVKECMEIPTKVKDTFGIERTFIVPVALKGEHTRWSKLVDAKEWKQAA